MPPDVQADIRAVQEAVRILLLLLGIDADSRPKAPAG